MKTRNVKLEEIAFHSMWLVFTDTERLPFSTALWAGEECRLLFSFLLCSKCFLSLTSHLLWSFSQLGWKTSLIFHISFLDKNSNHRRRAMRFTQTPSPPSLGDVRTGAFGFRYTWAGSKSLQGKHNCNKTCFERVVSKWNQTEAGLWHPAGQTILKAYKDQT